MKQKNDNFLLTAIFFILIFTLFQSQVNGQTSTAPVGDTEAAKWREDLRFMAQQMPRKHPNLFLNITREQFENAVKRLDERIPNLARHQIIVEMMRIAAMPGDGNGHTGIFPYFDQKINFRTYPVKLYQFKDGLFIRAADKQFQDAVGAKVVRIGNVSAEEAFKAVSETVSHDNEMTLKMRVPLYMVIPKVLQALGVIDDMENARLVVEKDGRQSMIDLKPTLIKQMPHGAGSNNLPENWVDAAMNAKSPAPLWQKSASEGYWFEYLEDSRTMYVQYNQTLNKEDETIASFFKRVFDSVETHDIDRFILDVRLNGGGNQFLNLPILLGIIKSNKINRRGHFFVITGRGTFSAAQILVNELERYTNALFVGEPTGARPHFYGDFERLTLPNSGIILCVSVLWWQNMDPKDARPWVAPSIAAELSSEDYRTNNDPAVNATLNYKSIAEALTPALSANDLELAVKQYKDFKSSPKTSPINTESEINTLGYRLMNANQLNQAIEIFKLNVESYPHSSNAYDSLGDAYAQAGKRDLAISSYQRALELNPKNEAAGKKLGDLKQK